MIGAVEFLVVVGLWAVWSGRVAAWPDGAPCLRTVFDSMNPLEAVEHQGGLEMSPPPFHIETEQTCYWRGQPIQLTLKGNSSYHMFKGFAIQPFIYSGPKRGQRLGQFLRLDNSGSWQQQCFRRADSVTHSHDEPKARIRMWWHSDAADEEDTVQFVATVVVSVRKFWVKSVVSAPLAPCRRQTDAAAAGWQGPVASLSVPPPVSSFKLDTFRMFNKEQSAGLALSLSSLPDRTKHLPVSTVRPSFVPPTVAPTIFQPQPQPTVFQQIAFPQQQQPFGSQSQLNTVTAAPQPDTVTHHRLNHVIPIAEMETNRRPNRLQQQPQQQSRLISNFQQRQQQQRQQIRAQQQQQQIALQQRRLPQSRVLTFTHQQNNECRDISTAQQCASWLGYCSRTAYMSVFCRQTCGLCTVQ